MNLQEQQNIMALGTAIAKLKAERDRWRQVAANGRTPSGPCRVAAGERGTEMTTRELAKEIANCDADEIYRRLILFLIERDSGYGVMFGEGDRGKAREYATRHGYYWLPCVLCGKWTGGQEKGGSLYIGNDQGIGVCEDCREEAKRLQVQYPDGLSLESPAGKR